MNALKRARRSAEQAGVSLSEWEGEFLDSVSERVKTHGRAFGDPEKGAPGQALSSMQGRKLKEIAAKARGEALLFLNNNLHVVHHAHPQVPWAVMYAMRNRLTHGYDTVDLDVVWKVIERDMPLLRSQIAAIER